MADEHLEWQRNVQVNQILAEQSSLTTNDFLEYYSNWYALQKGVAWLLRFVSFMKQRRRKMKALSGQLTVTEISAETVRIARYLQCQQFLDELKVLEASAERSPHCHFKGGVVKGSKLDILNPIVVDGILCVGGRIERSTISFSAKHPMILPQHHHITKMII